MLLVRIALTAAALAAALAAFLGSTAEKLPGVLAPVPAVCTDVPVLANGGLHAGYCP